MVSQPNSLFQSSTTMSLISKIFFTEKNSMNHVKLLESIICTGNSSYAHQKADPFGIFGTPQWLLLEHFVQDVFGNKS